METASICSMPVSEERQQLQDKQGGSKDPHPTSQRAERGSSPVGI